MARRKSAGRLERRDPMGIHAHREPRAATGRTASTRTPVHVRDTSGGAIDREWLRQRLGFKLGKFAMRIDRVDTTLRKEVDRAGNPIVRATILLRVPRYESITASAIGVSGTLAATAAIRAVERSLRRRLDKVETRRAAL